MSTKIHPSVSTPPPAKPRRLFSATTPPSSQKMPQRLVSAGGNVGAVRCRRESLLAPSGALLAQAWHGKQPQPTWRVAWQPPSPYLEDLTKTLVIAPPVRRKLQLVPAVRLKSATVSPYEPPRDASSRSGRYLRAHLQEAHPARRPLRPRRALTPHLGRPSQAELTDRHNRMLWEREAAAAASELGMDVYTYNTLLSMQHREITPEDYEVLQTLDSSLKPKTLSKQTMDEQMPKWQVPCRGGSGDSGAEGTAGEAVADDKDELLTCSICLCDLVAGEVARTLPCKHAFHAACIDAWLTENSHVCPADGLPVLPDD